MKMIYLKLVRRFFFKMCLVLFDHSVLREYNKTRCSFGVLYGVDEFLLKRAQAV